jgi:hypothetical protein
LLTRLSKSGFTSDSRRGFDADADADGVNVDVTESDGSAALDRADAKMSNRLGDRLILSLAI